MDPRVLTESVIKHTRDGTCITLWMTAVPILQILCGSVYCIRGLCHTFMKSWEHIEWMCMSLRGNDLHLTNSISLSQTLHCTFPITVTEWTSLLCRKLVMPTRINSVDKFTQAYICCVCGWRGTENSSQFIVCMQCYIIAVTLTLKLKDSDWLIGS